MGSRSFTRALALAFNEWLLMFMLFVNSIFSYVIARFADYSELQPPCLMCSRLDHIFGRTKHLKKTHWDMICSKHKSEISSLVYCHAHGKLVDVRGMCETCLFSLLQPISQMLKLTDCWLVNWVIILILDPRVIEAKIQIAQNLQIVHVVISCGRLKQLLLRWLNGKCYPRLVHLVK